MSATRGQRPALDERGALGISGAVSPRSGGAPARIAVVFGGPSPEHDVSILTGLQVLRALNQVPNIGELHSFYWAKSGEWFEVATNLEASAFLDTPSSGRRSTTYVRGFEVASKSDNSAALQGVPSGATPLRLVLGGSGGYFAQSPGRFGSKEQHVAVDAVIVCCHGGPGEDGSLQGVFDLIGLPYTGPSMAGALIGMDKLAFSALAASAWMQMLPRVLVADSVPPPSFPGPYIVKPRFGGSSIGIEVVADYETARARLRANPHLKRGAVLEPYRSDLFDLQIGVRLWPDPQLSAIEKPLRTQVGGEILGYLDKYVGPEGMTTAPRELPARISPDLERELRTAALEVAQLAGVRGVARIDFLSDGDALYVNEINTIPGSLGRHLWIDPPLAFAKLLMDLLGEALARPSISFSVAGADGAVLRGAGSISGKLG
ncbi:MAG: D-alanine--D-alanine ligase family protein [Acidimicrobiales bacterium]